MIAFLVFIEGILAFISPCILPMVPVYLVYLAGSQSSNRRRLVINTLGFICGFTVVFVLLGATATKIGSVLQFNKVVLQRVSGAIMMIFGLNYIGVINIGFLNVSKKFNAKTERLKFSSSFIFGIIFSFGWTPCLSTFLGSALILASNQDTLWNGVGLLFLFSMGLGIPFVLLTIFWDAFSGTLGFIKKNADKVRKFSGVLLIIVGFAFLFNVFGYYARLFN